MKPISLNIGSEYVDGFEVIGDVGRKRNKALEVGGDFYPNNDKDTWGKMFKSPDSNHNFTSKSRMATLNSGKRLYPNSIKAYSP